MSDESEAASLTADDSAGQTRGQAMMRESGKLSLLTMVSRILGLLREMTRATLMGTSPLGESFTVAYNTPNLFRKLLAEGAMSTAFIPTMKGYFAAGDDKSSQDFLSATFTVLSLVTGLVVAAGIAGAYYIAATYGIMSADASVAHDIGETAFLIRLMFPYLALVSVAAFFQGILNAHGVFVPSGIGPILFNLSFLLVPPLLVLWVPNPARAMALGVLVGGLLQAACQLPALIKLGVRFRFVGLKSAFGNPGMKRVLLLMLPTLLGMAVYELNAFVSTGLAYGVGAATSIQLSLRLQELILGLFVVSIGTVMLPELAGLAIGQAWERFVDRFKRSMEAVVLVTMPVVVFASLQRQNIVALLFQSGAFTAESVRLTAEIFLYHCLGLLFIALNRIIAPAFYALKDTRNPAWAGSAAFLLNMLLAWQFSRHFQGYGIALALSVASALNTVILVLMFLRKKVAGAGPAFLAVLLYSLKLLLLSVLAAVPVWLLGPVVQRGFGFSSRLLFAGAPLLIATLMYGVVGIALLLLTRDPVAAYLLNALQRRKKRSNRN